MSITIELLLKAKEPQLIFCPRYDTRSSKSTDTVKLMKLYFLLALLKLADPICAMNLEDNEVKGGKLNPKEKSYLTRTVSLIKISTIELSVFSESHEKVTLPGHSSPDNGWTVDVILDCPKI